MSQGEEFPQSVISLVALGSNVASDAGDARATVLAAADSMRMAFANVDLSGLYRTPAFPAGSGPEFVNAACAFTSDMDPRAILHILHEIEENFGRQRAQRWGQRTLDLDLIASGQDVLPDPETFAHWRDMPLDDQKIRSPDTLVLPHPRLQDRPFVLVPLADVAPDWMHPVLGQTVKQMLSAHAPAARAEVVRLG